MNSAGPVDLFVDLDVLRDLGAELQALINALADTGCRPATDPTAMGGPDVAEAVDRFTGRWQDGREKIIEKLRACVAYVELALSGYGQTEDGLRCSLTPTGTDGP